MFKKYLGRCWYTFALWVCRMFLVVFFRMHIRGQKNVPRKGAFLLICNHQSYLDPVFCGAPLRRQMAYVGRDTLFRSMIFKTIIASVGTIPIRRDKADLTAIKKMFARLSDGMGLCLFPEATRTCDGKIAPLKAGFSFIVRKAKVPIVPVVVDGAFECWPRHQKFFTPGYHISVKYGRCIPPEEVKSMSDDELAEYITSILRKMHNECRINRRKQPYDYELSEPAVRPRLQGVKN
ncbi:MAG: lysophospholipid acyltransferase family protein [Phycisphaerae bacterium]